MLPTVNLAQCRIADLECQVAEDQSFSDKLCHELEEQKEVGISEDTGEVPLIT